MHPINHALSLIGLQLSKIKKYDSREKEFRKKLDLDFEQLKNNPRGFEIYKMYRYQIGEHPKAANEFDMEFAAGHLYKEKPSKILDIGSHRVFILGLLAHYDVTTVDIRKRNAMLNNETVFNCDAKSLKFANNSFDSVTSLATLPHIGLGRYGDELDLDADIKVFHKMIRVLKPGGILIFSTAITGGKPTIAWNARRNYSYEMIRDLCHGLDLVEEKFLDRQNKRFCALEELTTDPILFDYYLGCWRKP